MILSYRKLFVKISFNSFPTNIPIQFHLILLFSVLFLLLSLLLLLNNRDFLLQYLFCDHLLHGVLSQHHDIHGLFRHTHRLHLRPLVLTHLQKTRQNQVNALLFRQSFCVMWFKIRAESRLVSATGVCLDFKRRALEYPPLTHNTCGIGDEQTTLLSVHSADKSTNAERTTTTTLCISTLAID